MAFGSRRPQLTPQEQEAQDLARVRGPRENELLGVLLQRNGASRCTVRCLDGKTRICRIPGRLKRKLWVRENDIVLVEPWEFEGDEKGDIVFKYRPVQVNWLKRSGFLDKMNSMDEF